MALVPTTLKKYWLLYRIAGRNAAVSGSLVVASTISTGLPMLGFYAIYKTAFSLNGTIGGLNFQLVIWSLLLTLAIYSSSGRPIFDTVSREVKNGSIEQRIVKPISYLLQTLVERSSRSGFFMLVNLLVVFVILLPTVGFPFELLNPGWIGKFILTFMLGNLVGSLLFLSIGLLSFWLHDAAPVMWTVDKLTAILGGSFVPIYLMPNGLKSFAELSPPGSILAAGTAFSPQFSERFLSIVGLQVFWLVIFLAMTVFIWHKVQKDISINGG